MFFRRRCNSLDLISLDSRFAQAGHQVSIFAGLAMNMQGASERVICFDFDGVGATESC